ncbi:MAG: DEAD/DEAH box helicase [Bdellovibrionales bacterium]|nr:DEAD/DEAH box helicase [Bdellovibrionales bacterium]
MLPFKTEALPADLLTSVLNSNCMPYDYQLDCINWLYAHLKQKSGGLILADDMGLGKTLQLLSFAAAFKSEIKPDNKGQTRSNLTDLKKRFGWAPILIVAPIILLRNWQNEIAKFIKPDVFAKLLVFHGHEVKKTKEPDGSLDLNRLEGYDIILTNYRTFASYQQDLLRVKFSLVFFDESQNIKNPDTAASRAARGLKADFVVCATGTPVENRLQDFWTQTDTLNRLPSNPLGSKSKFNSKYAKDAAGAAKIREIIQLNTPQGIMIRREKSIVKGLPKKFAAQMITCKMTEAQIQKEKLIVQTHKKSALKILDNLQRLYQHPVLLGMDTTSSSQEFSIAKLIEESPKLAATLDLLNQIQIRGEKVLIFALWVRMQSILKTAISKKFGFDVDIINGESNRKGEPGESANKMIKDFSDKSGFNILILSPLAAGAGLNIVAANNVIHYGRWWNPAKEDQATDRAYRIGQKKDVNVYYPILVGPENSGFDLALHQLVEKKRSLARDILTPMDELEINEADLNDILGG